MAQLEKNAFSAISLNKGQATTTSVVLAEFFNIEHETLLHDIREMLLHLSESFAKQNFEETTYLVKGSGAVDENATREQPCYRLTSYAVAMLDLQLQGERRYQLKEAIVNAFRHFEKRRPDFVDQNLQEIAQRLLNASAISQACKQIMDLFPRTDNEGLAGITVDRIKRRLVELVTRTSDAEASVMAIFESMDDSLVTEEKKELLNDILARAATVSVPVESFRSIIHVLLDYGITKDQIMDVFSSEPVIVAENDPVFVR